MKHFRFLTQKLVLVLDKSLVCNFEFLGFSKYHNKRIILTNVLNFFKVLREMLLETWKILYNQADQKQTENTPDRDHARWSHYFRDILLQFTSVRPNLKNCFSSMFKMFPADRNNIEIRYFHKNYWSYVDWVCFKR